VTLAGFAGGALLLTPVALVAGLRFTDDPVALAVLLYLGAVPSALAYALFFAGLRTVPGAVASIVTLLEPLTATALAMAFLGERLAPAALAGGLLVLAAVAGLYVRRLRESARTARTASWTTSDHRLDSAAIAPRAES
jgi:DME family drug/metabolite transporter